MWGKPFKGRSSILKTSDRKKLKESILKSYPALTIEALDSLIPSKGDSVTSTKVQGGYTVIYCVDNEPVFFDVDSRNTLYPTGTRWAPFSIVPQNIRFLTLDMISIRSMEATAIHAFLVHSSSDFSISGKRRRPHGTRNSFA